MVSQKHKETSLEELVVLISHQSTLVESQLERSNKLLEQLVLTNNMLLEQALEISRLGVALRLVQVEVKQGFDVNQLDRISHRFKRNFLPNDSSLSQKTLMAIWQAESTQFLSYKDILASGFRVFSQNDEDGMLLRIFTHIGITNKCVIEIGSNCSDSDLGIPENISTNLIVNHGWHGLVFEIDLKECSRIQYFFARDLSTKHYHFRANGNNGYFSPLIVSQAISPENINQVLADNLGELAPDLMVIDIDGGDYEVIQRMKECRPRVIVVEFEKLFRDTYSVVQFCPDDFSSKWPQSGTASLSAWVKLLGVMGYALCAIGTCGFNAFFIRSDIATSKFLALNASDAFDNHPILSQVSDEFWIAPDETWQAV